MKFLRISWAKTQMLCEKLAKKVASYEPDVLVGISRGGLVPVRLLSDMLDIHAVGIIRIEFYKSAGKPGDLPRITQGLQMDITGKRVLVVDDVSDTGKSLEVAKEYLETKGAGAVRFATLHHKPQSIFKPQYYIEETDKWIVYPWEIHEVKRDSKNVK